MVNLPTQTGTRRELLASDADARVVDGVQLAVAPYNDRFQYRLGSALSPQRLTAVLRNADTGYLYDLADLLDELRETDPHLHAELFKREAAVSGAEWEIRPPEGSGDAGVAVADYCTQVLRDIESDSDTSLSFADALSHLMGAVYYGRAVCEVVWTDDGRAPRALEFVHPRRLAYAVDWRLHIWDATGVGSGPLGHTVTPAERAFATFPGVPLDIFPRGKFIAHRPRIRGGYPTREGIGRTVAWFAMFKKFSIRDLLAFAEWAGRGLRIGKYASGNDPQKPARASDEDVSVLQEALNAMSSTVSVVIPDTTDLTVQNAPSNNDVHDALTRLCNGEISKAILGATLTSEVGSTGGNRALGEVHERVAQMIARADATSLAATLRRDLLRPMVERRFGPGAPVPSFAFAVDPKDSLNALSERIERAVRMGVKVGQSDVRNLLGLPDPAPGAEILAPVSGPRGGGL